MKYLEDNLNEATDEIAKALADLDSEEIIELLPTIRQRLETAQTKLLDVLQFYKIQ